ncbi:McrC family protein [Salinicoccus roseus]|uniref:Restriction endonuclease n=1 Tax=Salinicoccus roseus TaxID=45670 RepID=A0A0C2DLQ3_9STAP|nr:hypothetical protein [Salinicoccus roseus]KIH70943.1 hypothetical protein SN16_05125 [Salinicoccus roseus]MDB0580166.1 hypothetical protein [Salinicoccus roseus]
MKVIDVIENNKIIVEEDLLKKNDDFINTEKFNKSLYSVTLNPKGIEITAGNNIGLIPITSKLSLNVKPKIPIQNFIYLLMTSSKEVKIFSDFYRSYNKLSSFNNLIDLLTNTFLNHLRIIEKEGIYKGTVKRVENSSAIKGKVLFKENLYQNTFKNTDYKVVHTYEELDRNILPNQLIKLTLEHLFHHYKNLNYKDVHLLKEMDYFRDIFSRVTYNSNLYGITKSEFNNLQNSIPTVRDYYLGALEICYFIINRASFDFESNRLHSQVSLPSIYIDMEDVFERYLLNSLNEIKKNIDDSIYLYKGKKNLFDDMTKPDIEPDIVVERNNKLICLADAKYKAIKPTREDFFQMISYLSSYNCDIGIFILPKNENLTFEYLGELQNKHLYVYRIKLDNEEVKCFRDEEEKLFKFLIDPNFERNHS